MIECLSPYLRNELLLLIVSCLHAKSNSRTDPDLIDAIGLLADRLVNWNYQLNLTY